jgi:4a-hydroxytetrahydrobiopterin dehydratase
MSDHLHKKKCEPCEGIGAPLNAAQVDTLMPQLDKAWHVLNDATMIKRSFAFENFYETIAFVNAIAWIANQENHHPDLEIGYNYCHISFTTHALKGLSHNDFICAAKVDALQ